MNGVRTLITQHFPFHMPPRRQSSVKIPMTPYEDELLLIAVRLDSAARHWERQLGKNKAVDASWMKDSMGEELVSSIHSFQPD